MDTAELMKLMQGLSALQGGAGTNPAADPSLLAALGNLGTLGHGGKGMNPALLSLLGTLSQFSPPPSRNAAAEPETGAAAEEEDDYCACDRCSRPCPRRIHLVSLAEVRRLAAGFGAERKSSSDREE